jgi:hypothetical protein
MSKTTVTVTISNYVQMTPPSATQIELPVSVNYGIPDAASDGKTYGRKDKEWIEVRVDVDDSVTELSENPVKSSGIWAWVVELFSNFTIKHEDTTERDAANSHPADAISLDATGFTKNLDGTVTDVQLLAEAVDKLEASGGLETVAVDGVTITGDGTPANPLVAIGATANMEATILASRWHSIPVQDWTLAVTGSGARTNNESMRVYLSTGATINSTIIISQSAYITYKGLMAGEAYRVNFGQPFIVEFIVARDATLANATAYWVYGSRDITAIDPARNCFGLRCVNNVFDLIAHDGTTLKTKAITSPFSGTAHLTKLSFYNKGNGEVELYVNGVYKDKITGGATGTSGNFDGMLRISVSNQEAAVKQIYLNQVRLWA